MKIRHILKSGKEVADISGIVIKKSEFPELYALLERMVEHGCKNADVPDAGRVA